MGGGGWYLQATQGATVSSPLLDHCLCCSRSQRWKETVALSVNAETLHPRGQLYVLRTSKSWRKCFSDRMETSELKFGPLMKSKIPQRLPRETQAIPKTTIIISGNLLCFVFQNGIIIPELSVCMEKKVFFQTSK